MIKLSPSVMVLLFINLSLILAIIYFAFLVDETAIRNIDTNFGEESVAAMVRNKPDQPTVNFSVLLDQALFHRTRAKIEIRREQPTVKVEVKKGVPSSSFLLQGIVFHSNDMSVAYLRNTSLNKDISLKVNEEFEGWRVMQILRNSIIIKKGAEQSTLRLIKDE